MDTQKTLGKITAAYFGISGYQGCEIGLFLAFSAGHIGCSFSKSAWDAQRIECSKHAKWTEADRIKSYDEIVRYVSKVLADAKRENVAQLVGVPVELEFDCNTLKSWRVLTEVL